MQQVIRWVKEEVQIPVIAKLSIHVNDIGKMALYAAEAGADAVTGINSIHGIGPLNPERMVHIPDIMGQSAPMGLSGAFIKPMAQHCIYKMALAAKEKPFGISAVGGITDGKDALEYLCLGADTLQSATAVMYKGYGIIRQMISYLEKFMMEKGYQSLDEFRGYSLNHMASAARNLSLKQQLAALVDPDKCIGCGKCAVSCSDGGKQAIQLETSPRKALVCTEKCTGCGLCQIVCPTGAIQMVPTER